MNACLYFLCVVTEALTVSDTIINVRHVKLLVPCEHLINVSLISALTEVCVVTYYGSVARYLLL